jgi:serine/threonine protein kinase
MAGAAVGPVSSSSNISSNGTSISTSTSSGSLSSLAASVVYDNGTGAPTSGSGTMAKYKMIKKIGQGNFGVVFLAEWAEDHKVTSLSLSIH